MVKKVQLCKSCPSGAACFRLQAKTRREIASPTCTKEPSRPPPTPLPPPPYRGMFNEEQAKWWAGGWKTHSWRENGNG